MREYVDDFLSYITREKHASANTITSYRRDLGSFIDYLSSSKIDSFAYVSARNIDEYLHHLELLGKKCSTVSRATSSIKSFYRYLCMIGVSSENPSKVIHPSAHKRSLPNVLTAKEIDLLLSQPDGSSEKSIRDRAMLELLYATGLRVSEMMNLNINDVNLDIGFVRCQGEKAERVIPLYAKACQLLREYRLQVRPLLAYSEDEPALFLNLSGERLSRQGFWKILRGYADAAGISKPITPQTLRHSFALHLLENGADIHVISSMMGHADISSTQIYNEIIKQKISNSYTQFHPHAAK